MEVRHEPGVRLATHSHLLPSLCTVLDGGFDEWIDGNRFEAGPASLLVEPSEMPHRSAFGKQPTRSLILEVEAPELLARLRAHDCDPASPVLVRGEELMRVSRRLETELHLDDPASSLAIEGLALELVALSSGRRFERRSHAPPAWLRRVAEVLRERFRDELDVEALAHEVGVHPAHLSRAFRRHFSETLGEQMRRLRLEWCAERLRADDQPIAEIAVAAGFCDQSHLARHFRRTYGCTPGRYRRDRRMPRKG